MILDPLEPKWLRIMLVLGLWGKSIQVGFRGILEG